MRLELILVLFILANIADFIWTLFYLGMGVQELNPFLNLLMRKIGTLPAMVSIKIMAFACAFFLYVVAEGKIPTKSESRHARVALLVLTGASLIVVMWHLWGFWRLLC